MKRLLIALTLLLVFAATANATQCWNGTAGAMSWYSHNVTYSNYTIFDLCEARNSVGTAPTANETGYWNLSDGFNGAAGHYATLSSAQTEALLGVWDNTLNASYTAWFYLNATADQRLITFAYSGSSTWQFEVTATDILRISFRDSTGATLYTTQSAGAITENAWHFVAVTWDGSTRNLSLWDNNTLMDSDLSAAWNNVSFTGATNWLVGYTDGTTFDGRIDEQSFFNYTLSATERNCLLTTNTFDCATSVAVVNFSPTAVPINESQLFTATASGNVTAASAWYWNFSYGGIAYFYNSTGTNMSVQNALNFTGGWNLTVWGTFGGVNYTTTNGTINVTTRPIANFSIATAAPYMILTSLQFNDTTNYGAFSYGKVWWDFNDTNVSIIRNATNTFVTPGYYYVCLTAQNNFGFNSSAPYCSNTTLSGMSIDAFNAVTYAALTNWTLVISNTTTTQTFTPQNNSWLTSNYTVPTGSLTITVSRTGFVQATYYATYLTGSVVNLDAYLLDTASGIYPVFIVRDASTYIPLEGAVLTFRKLISGSYVTMVQKTSDSTGTAQAYLDPTVTYRLTVDKTGYNTYTTDAFTPVATTYVISLNTSSAFEYFNVSNILYMKIKPQAAITVPYNGTVEFECNDPWSNVVSYNLSIVADNGTQMAYTNGSTASCGILTLNVNTTGIANYSGFTAYGWVVRNGVAYGTFSHYDIVASFNFTGIAGTLWNAGASGVIDEGAQWIIAFGVTAFATIAAASIVGWGAGLIGGIVLIFFALISWISWYLVIFAIVAMIAVYASKRWD